MVNNMEKEKQPNYTVISKMTVEVNGGVAKPRPQK